MLVTFLTLLVNAMTITIGHLCIKDPPQRLSTGNVTTVDCYQNSDPPCGKDFPKTPSLNPRNIKLGVNYTVQLHMPFRHYDANKPGSYVISIQKSGTQDFTLLGQWPDNTEEFRNFTVQMPARSGLYLLQAIYQPAGRAYYSCADIVIQEDSSGMISRDEGSNQLTRVSQSNNNGGKMESRTNLLMVTVFIISQCASILSL